MRNSKSHLERTCCCNVPNKKVQPVINGRDLYNLLSHYFYLKVSNSQAKLIQKVISWVLFLKYIVVYGTYCGIKKIGNSQIIQLVRFYFNTFYNNYAFELII